MGDRAYAFCIRMRARRVCLLMAALAASATQAATRTVGAGKTYSNIAAAVAAAATTGDVIEIHPGTYSGATNIVAIGKSLIIRGVGTRPLLNATGQTIANRKAIFVTSGADIVVENLAFTGASVPDKNGAGIRAEGARLTVRNCSFYDNENGILSGNAGGEILVEYCDFDRNGNGDGQSHNIYIGVIDRLTFRFNRSRRSRSGHLLKSRALTNYVLYNFFADENETVSYEIDLPQGGLSYVIGNAIQQGSNAGNNGTIVTYAEENRNNATQELYVVNNTIVNDRSAGTFINVVGPPTKALVMNNVFVGNGTILNGTGTLSNNATLNGSQLVNRSGYDYRLIPTSTAIDAGLDPGFTNGFSLTPLFEYAATATGLARAVEWKLDLGAHESTNAVGDRNGDGMEDNWQRRFFGTLANTNSLAGADSDGDGFSNLQEYRAGLIPTDEASRLAIRSLVSAAGQVTLNWLGGTSVWQVVESKRNIADPGEVWRAVCTNAPALTTTHAAVIGNVTNRALYFRVNAGGER